MKRKKEATLAEIQCRGLDALTRELGPGGALPIFSDLWLGRRRLYARPA